MPICNAYIYIYINIYIYIYLYINFKAINNTLDSKMVLKHICLLKIFRFLYRSFVTIYIYIYIHIYIYIYDDPLWILKFPSI